MKSFNENKIRTSDVAILKYTVTAMTHQRVQLRFPATAFRCLVYLLCMMRVMDQKLKMEETKGGQRPPYRKVGREKYIMI